MHVCMVRADTVILYNIFFISYFEVNLVEEIHQKKDKKKKQKTDIMSKVQFN